MAQVSRTTCMGARIWVVGGILGWGNLGFGSWVCAIEQCTRGGGCLEPTAKTEPSGLSLGKQHVGGLYFSRGDLGGVWEVQLKGVGVVIGPVHSRGGLGLLTWLAFLLAFPISFPLHKARSNFPSLLPIPPRWTGDWPCAFVVG